MAARPASTAFEAQRVAASVLLEAAWAEQVTKSTTYWVRCRDAVTADGKQLDLDLYYACQREDADFIKACRALSREEGGPGGSGASLADAEAKWCQGNNRTDEKAYSMGMVIPPKPGTPVWQLRGVVRMRKRSSGR